MQKKKATKPAQQLAEYDSGRETRDLLEEMNKGVKTIGEQHGSIVKRLDNIEFKLEQHTPELQIIKTTVHTIKATVHANISELNSVKMAVMELDNRAERIEKKLDTTVSQNEERFKIIEAN